MLVVLVVNTEVVPKPSIESDRMKEFLDDPQWSEHIKRLSTKANQEANFFKYVIMFGIFLLDHSCS